MMGAPPCACDLGHRERERETAPGDLPPVIWCACDLGALWGQFGDPAARVGLNVLRFAAYIDAATWQARAA